MIRTHDAGTLRASDAGQTVTLAGWVATRRDHGGVDFIDLRDALRRRARSWCARTTSRTTCATSGCVAVTGEVRLRPRGQRQPGHRPPARSRSSRPTLEVLNEAAPLPFQIDEHTEVGEEARLKYRYLDLRRPGPAAAMRLRSEVNRAARDVLLRRTASSRSRRRR